MDSITKADGMGGVRLVHFPGSVRVVLDDNALALIAEALESEAEALRRTADRQYSGPHKDVRAAADRCELLAEVVRGSDEGTLTLENHDDGREDGVTTRRCAALVQALVDAGAQA